MRLSLGSGDAFRFCCGEMGNFDFLLDYSRINQLEDIENETRSSVVDVVDKIISLSNTRENHQIPELTFPGLFQGQSGIVYSASRFILPDLPSLSGQYMSDLTY
jgi:lantibiotic modifying enzyme